MGFNTGMTGQAIKQALGKNIKAIRARRGLSQAALAEKVIENHVRGHYPKRYRHYGKGQQAVS